MPFEIRNCRIEDAPSICRLNETEMGYGFPLEQTRKKLQTLLNSSTDRIIVAVLNGEVVGYVHACDYEVLYAPSMKNIMGIAVDSAYNRRGIGRSLLHAVEEWAKETGAVGVRLVSGEERSDAHKFYQSCGYVYGKDQKNFKKLF